MKLPFKKSKKSSNAPFTPKPSPEGASSEEKKSSFRNMMILIFVILLCFGGTIYGIIYIIDAFDQSTESVAPKQAQKPSVTNPDQGDVLMFSKNEEMGDEVMPENDNVIKSIEMQRDRNVNTSNIMEEPEVDNKKPEPMPTRRPNIVIIDNKEDAKKAEPKKEVAKTEPRKEEAKKAEPKKEVAKTEPRKEEAKKAEPKKEVAKTEPRKEEAKKAEPKKEVAKTEPKKEEVKKAEVKTPAPTKQNTKTVAVNNPELFVVQAAALKTRDDAVTYAKRLQQDYPDVFVMEAVVDGKTVYRVRLGVSDSYAKARAIGDKLDAKYKTKSMVISHK